MKYFLKSLIILNSLFIFHYSHAQFTRQDTLRGANGPGRNWWDVLKYNIQVTPDFITQTISGRTTIEYTIIKERTTDYLQIDLQQPLSIDTIYYDGKVYINYPAIPYYNEGNVWHIPLPRAALNTEHEITIVYHGKPVIATRPPWDGGWIFAQDARGRPWMSVACQGLGASSWFPCKDYQADEPDRGAELSITIPDSLTAIANGRLKNIIQNPGTKSWTWEVKSPINNYNIIPYIGNYVNWKETYHGEKGNLDCSYWVLDYNLEKAKDQFKQAALTLKAFEHWFGPYPFYEDGFKLVEAPHLGMEHQSAVAYGNGFQNGYRGRDLSGTGWGLKWDFIIVHEVGHEWFGNNITTKDIADMWVHEGFTNYSETLFTEYYYGKEAGSDYCIGTRRLIRNDIPIVGPYGVNKEGSGDMYYKGGNMIHTIRQLIHDDEKFRQILRGLNKNFYHMTVTGKDVENYISQQSGMDLSKIFDQYLRTIKIPVLEYKVSAYSLFFRWNNCVPAFNMRVKLTDDTWLHPTINWKEIPLKESWKKGIEADRNFYITVKKSD